MRALNCKQERDYYSKVLDKYANLIYGRAISIKEEKFEYLPELSDRGKILGIVGAVILDLLFLDACFMLVQLTAITEM